MDKKKKHFKVDYEKSMNLNKKQKSIISRLFKRYITAPSIDGIDINGFG